MRFTLRALLLSALLIPGLSLSQERPLYISPLLSFENFRTPGFGYGMDFGAGAGVRITPSLVLSASVATGTRSITIDVIGGSQNLSGRIVVAEVSLEMLLWGRAGGTGLAASLGGGRFSGTVDAHAVALGALGSVTLPEQSAARGYARAAVTGEFPLAADVVAVISPALRFFTPVSSSLDFSIAGGLRVGIL